MYILIVEDDHLYADWLQSVLEKHFRGAEFRRIGTESEFRNGIGEIAAHPPDIVILDIMLRWTRPSPNMPPMPSEIDEEGFYRAGFRCERLLREHEATKNTPVILYTVLEKNDLKKDLVHQTSNVVHLGKSRGAKTLIEAIERIRMRG